MIISAHSRDVSIPFPVSAVVKEAEEATSSSLYRVLTDPIELTLGGMWAFFLALGTWSVVESGQKLYAELKEETPFCKRLSQIGSVVKEALTNLVGLGGTVAYTTSWAHEVKLLSLGTKAALVQSLGLASSVFTSGVDGVAALYHAHRAHQGILTEQSPEKQEKHKQYLCLALMKLIGNVSMVAWALLGIAAGSFSIAASPFLMIGLLGASGFFSGAAFFYEWKLENRPELFPYPAHWRIA